MKCQSSGFEIFGQFRAASATASCRRLFAKGALATTPTRRRTARPAAPLLTPAADCPAAMQAVRAPGSAASEALQRHPRLDEGLRRTAGARRGRWALPSAAGGPLQVLLGVVDGHPSSESPRNWATAATAGVTRKKHPLGVEGVRNRSPPFSGGTPDRQTEGWGDSDTAPYSRSALN